jgi:glutaminyl-tRNA synthetase
MEINGTVLSKRRLLKLVEEKKVNGWDDPRLCTLNGLRRRGYTPEAINQFCNVLSVTRNGEAAVDLAVLEGCCRKVMNRDARRVMAVLDPLKVVVANYPADKTETITVHNHPTRPELGEHTISFSRVLYIERSDFRLEDSKGYKRLAPGKCVRLRYSHHIVCTKVHKDEAGNILYLEAEYDEKKESKPAGTIHWVAEPRSGLDPMGIEVRVYDRLFKSDNPSALPSESFFDDLNPNSLQVIPRAFIDAASADGLDVGSAVQFERLGFFSVDLDSKPGALVFNRTVSLKDTFDG